MRCLVWVGLLVLAGCADDAVTPLQSSSTPDLEEIVALNDRALRRMRDPASGISFPFPRSWKVESAEPFLWNAWARAGGTRPNRTVASVSVQVLNIAGRTAADHLMTLQRDAPADTEVLARGTQEVGRFTARTLRLRRTFPDGPTIQAVYVFERHGRLGVLVGTCRADVRAAFVQSLAIIVEGIQWAPPR